MSVRRIRLLVGAAVLGSVTLLSACGQPAPLTAPAAPPAPAPPAATAPAAAAPSGGTSGPAFTDSTQVAASLGTRSSEGGYWPTTLQLGSSPQLGRVVLDGQGFTLYRFDKDTAHPSASNCSGKCLDQWPPVLANDRLRFQNLDPQQLGVVQRPDGTQQVTVGGWPAYRYIQDLVPGQAAGQGVGGTWFVLAPDGSKAGKR
jgi:predicted lipoprotein with Yx(FWY)xxD motif